MLPRFCITLSALLLSLVPSSFGQRSVEDLRDGWRFTREPVLPSSPVDQWEPVQVPHTWNSVEVLEGRPRIRKELQSQEEAKADAEQRKQARPKPTTFSMRQGYYRGECWYARSLNIPAEWKGNRRVFLRFEAASTVARVYLNERLLGEHRGGFTAFCFELTDVADFGGKNELRVAVDNSFREDLAPLAIDVSIDGGLYRPVALITTDRIAVTPLDFASPGVYIQTLQAGPQTAEVEVRSLVSNGWTKRKEDAGNGVTDVAVVTEIKDAKGTVVTTGSTMQTIPLETTGTVAQRLTVRDPHLWAGRPDPYLYDAVISVRSGGKVLDEIKQPFGIRTVAVDPAKGFLLNGKTYPVHGVNRHQDVRGRGWALTSADHERDMQLICEMGATAVRNAHYPQSEYWHQLADRSGILLWNEVSNVDTIRNTRAYWANTEEQLREMIHQLYNHPSVAWWGLFNELGNEPTPPCMEGFQRLQAAAKECDTTRPTVAATNRQGLDVSAVPDAIAINVYPGWYGKVDPADPVAMESTLLKWSDHLGRRFGISEYGAGADIAHHTEGAPTKPDATTAPFHPEEWQAFVHEQDWKQIQKVPAVWGSFLWVMFDFSSWKRDEGGTPRLNDKGMVTHDREIKKDAFYFYKANWNPEPQVYIASRRATKRKQAVTEVKVYSNCESVTLRVNGKEIGKATPDDEKIARWQGVTLQPGVNVIEASTKVKDRVISDSCQWQLEP